MGTDDDQSITSQDEALLEMLGLSSPSVIVQADEDETEQASQPCDPACKSIKLASSRQSKLLEGPHGIPLPRNVSRHFHDPKDCFAYAIPDLLSPEECQHLIALGGTGGFDYIRHAMHTAADGSTYQVELQNPNRHKLSVFQHSAWVDKLWNRIRPIIFSPKHEHSDTKVLASFLRRESVSEPTGLNPRLRVLQYDAEDQDEFSPHFDATTRIGGQISLLTVLLYLNSGDGDDFDGGETYFLNASSSTANKRIETFESDNSCMDASKVTPQVGTAVIFEHDLYHSGHPLKWGTKFVLRTDILFEISETEWEQRAIKAAAKKNLAESKSPGKAQTNKGGTGQVQPTTVHGLLDDLSTQAEWNIEERDRLSNALGALGMLDASIETFCAPGRFALQLMLRDALLGGEGPANKANQQGLARQIVDQAFLRLQEART